MTSATDLNKYIKRISEGTILDRPTTERIINTQFSFLLGDLAVTGRGDCFLGTLVYNEEEDTVDLEPNEFFLGLIKGNIDPSVILREILENV